MMRARALPTLTFRRPRLKATLPHNIAGYRLLIGLALAVATVAALQNAPLARALQAGLASLDFDRSRVALLSAWIFCFALALLAGALTARPWPSVLVATTYLGVTYSLPWTLHAFTTRPVLFGSPERLDTGVLAANLAAIMAVGFLASVVAAATGRQLSELVRPPGRRPAAPGLPTTAAPPVPIRALLLGAVAIALTFSALGAESLLRYGPAHHLYSPASRGAAALKSQVLDRTLHSQVMSADRPFAVYLPPSYQAGSQKRFPVVYLLHGNPGSYRDWVSLGIGNISDAGIASGSLAEAVVVMPDGNGALHRRTQWADSRDGQERVESSILELVALVDHDYRTMADRRHRVIAGLSEGGFGAANLAARHPDIFGVAISLSGYFRADGVAGDNTPYLRANSPSALVADQTAARSVRFILVAGESDGRYLRNAEVFAAELDRFAVPHTLLRVPGGHDGGVWTNGLVLSLEQVKPQLQERRT
jgi:enterochelin esterase-like enzyme